MIYHTTVNLSNIISFICNIISFIRDHQNYPIIQRKSWICMGDFNEILEVEEHSNFENAPSILLGMRDFQNVVRECLLEDMPSQGPLFT